MTRTCPACGGSGSDVARAPTDRGVEEVETECSACEGSGTEYLDPRKPADRSEVARELVGGFGALAACAAAGIPLRVRDPQADYAGAAESFAACFQEAFGCSRDFEVALGLDVVRLDAAMRVAVVSEALAALTKRRPHPRRWRDHVHDHETAAPAAMGDVVDVAKKRRAKLDRAINAQTRANDLVYEVVTDLLTEAKPGASLDEEDLGKFIELFMRAGSMHGRAQSGASAATAAMTERTTLGTAIDSAARIGKDVADRLKREDDATCQCDSCKRKRGRA